MPPSPKPPLLVTLGHDAIDDDHRGFVQCIAGLVASDAVGFPTRFRGLVEHIEQHFARENELMERYAFPALREHKADHVRVQGECQQFLLRVERGFQEFGRAFVLERLVPWFELHTTTMDAALVVHMRGIDASRADAISRR